MTKLSKILFILFFLSILSATGSQLLYAESDPEIFSQGMKLFKQKEYLKAQEYFKTVIKTEKNNEIVAAAFYYSGESFLNMNKYQEAAESFEKLVNSTKYTGYRQISIYKLGQIYFNISQFAKSRERFNELLSKYPYSEFSGSAYYWIGESFAIEEQLDSAIASYHNAIERKASNGYLDYTIYSMAEAYENSKDYENAVKYYEEILSFYRDSELFSNAQIRIGICYFKMKEYDSSILELNNPVVKELTPEKKTEALYLLANSYYKINEFDNAAKTYSELISKYPKSKYIKDAQYALAWSNFQMKKYNDAYKIFNHLSASDDSMGVKSFYWKGESKRYAGYDEDALLIYDEFIKKFPFNPMSNLVHYQAGMIYYQNKKFDVATNFLLKATASPDIDVRAKSFALLGEIELNSKNYQQAYKYYNAARDLDPKNSDVYNRSILGLAISNFYSGNTKEAFDLLKTLEDRSPGFENSKINFFVAECYFSEGKYSDALDYYNRVSTDNEEINNLTMYGKAYSYFNSRDYVNASFQFADYLKKYSSDEKAADARIRLADSYFADKKYSMAIGIYEQLLTAKQRMKNSDYVHYQYVLALFRNNQREKALSELIKFQSSYPKSQYYENSLYLTGWIAFQQRNYTEAINNYRRFLELAPNSSLKPLIFYSIGDAFFNIGDYDSAIVSYEKIIREHPNSNYVFDALNGINYSYVSRGEPEKAISIIDNFVAQNSNSQYADKLALKKGEILYSLRSYEEAKRSYSEFISRFPNSKYIADAYYWIGKSNENSGNNEEAIKNYNIVFNTFPGNDISQSAVVEAGNILMKQKKYDDAINMLERALNVFRDSKRIPELMFLKGDAYLKKGDVASAFDVFDELVIYYETNIFADKARLELGKIELASKRYENAVKQLQHLVTKRTDDLAAEAQYYLGKVYFDQKKYNEAITSFVRVINLFPNYVEWNAKSYLALAECYEKQKDINKAKEIYRTIISKYNSEEYGKEAQLKLRKLK